MVGTSIPEASGQRNGSHTILPQKRQLSSLSPSDRTNREGKKRSTMLMDLEILDCPICCEAFTIPIFQCDNGHLAYSSCCPKLRNLCPLCALHVGHNRCRAMETYLESILIPCQNAKLGCTKNVFYGKESNHEKKCVFSRCSCPALDCDYTSSYKDLYLHYIITHMDMEIYQSSKFSCNVSFIVPMNISKKMLIRTEYAKNLMFALQCFKEPYGVYVTLSCIAPSVDGHAVIYKSPEVKRVHGVSFETSLENSMLIPNSLLRGEMLEMKLFIKEW
ncbi:PREDICTED: E3 ubiquitin-protein ligase SINA-like 7 [Camelina sativa]|uniref:RING-type E3 ubiquitin transferase n=1 Tax=Camelina sativa TaxID=90675 RepID=A0ABM0V6P2_CAMSA|nr:PREDICTED: E3 ubiquitin-protein ligase SINA-like 7 [Camelina sativa]